MEGFETLYPGDESMKLLDNGWTIQIYRSEKSGYTAIAIPPRIRDKLDEAHSADEMEIIEAKDTWFVDECFTPTESLKSLTESVLFGKKEDEEE